nr:DASH family cryptochrome [Oceanococcus sp. HetDA_MAG_MS8]
MRTGLFLFGQDLRLDDHPALGSLAARVDRLLCVFVVDPLWFKPGWCQRPSLGPHRWKFLYESLLDLQADLQSQGQQLVVVWGDPIVEVGALIQRWGVTDVARSAHPGVYENRQWQELQQRFGEVRFSQAHTATLFSPERLPFALEDLPGHFSPFRRKVEKRAQVRPPEAMLSQLPAMVSDDLPREWPKELPKVDFDKAADWVGGSRMGNMQLNEFLFQTHAVQSYKETRNALDTPLASSRLSPWLANGSLSVARVAAELARYEQEVLANESTYWLFFELLWREYFQWYAWRHGQRLFAFAGVREQRPMTSHYAQRLRAWEAGETGYPIVDACMRQLATTGWMSNRGRQLVASCFVHELELDWRFGATWFEQQLVDYDLGSNYGNWQYLAGVGADPRGHRRFDLAKQTRMYDPNEEFIRKWGSAEVVPLNAVDAADWPYSS